MLFFFFFFFGNLEERLQADATFRNSLNMTGELRFNNGATDILINPYETATKGTQSGHVNALKSVVVAV